MTSPGSRKASRTTDEQPSSAPATRILPYLIAVAFFMESLDTTILNTAVPIVSKALGVTPLSMKAVLASYTLSLAVFIPISGWMADRFGTRRVFASAIGMFTFGSILCGLSSDVHFLIASRIIQGFGGAMMVPVGRLTLVRTYQKYELVKAMSFVAIPALVGPMVGPVIGGFMVDYVHWRAIFFINVPIGLLGLTFVYLHLPDYRESNRRALDAVGFVLFGAGIALLSYVLEIFGEHTLSTPEIAGLFLLSVALLGGYGIHAAHTRHPLLSLGLFRIRTFATAVSGSFITRLGVAGVPFLLPLLYQEGLGYAAALSGLLILPQAVASWTTKFIMPQLLARMGYRTVLTTNTALLGLMLMSFATIGIGTPVWLIVIQAFCYGALTSTQYTSMNSLAYADVPPNSASGASSLASMMQQLSMSFGVATAGLISSLFILDRGRSDPAEIIGGLHSAFLALGAFTVLSTLNFARLKSGDGALEAKR